jgi:hypothetical protein
VYVDLILSRILIIIILGCDSFEAYYRTNQLSNKSQSDIAWIGSVETFWLVRTYPWKLFL